MSATGNGAGSGSGRVWLVVLTIAAAVVGLDRFFPPPQFTTIDGSRSGPVLVVAITCHSKLPHERGVSVLHSPPIDVASASVFVTVREILAAAAPLSSVSLAERAVSRCCIVAPHRPGVAPHAWCCNGECAESRPTAPWSENAGFRARLLTGPDAVDTFMRPISIDKHRFAAASVLRIEVDAAVHSPNLTASTTYADGGFRAM